MRLLGRSNWPGRARRRGGDRRRRCGAWRAAWRLAKGSGARGEYRRGQADIQVSPEAFLGPDGRGRAVDEVHRWRTASGGGNREGDEGRDLFAIFEILGTSR